MQKLENILNWLDGKKTYLSLIFGAIIYSLHYFGAMNDKVFEWFVTMDGLFFAFGLRSAMNKIGK